MKNVKTMTKLQLINWGMKTRASISSYCNKNFGMNRMQSSRAYDLIDRYTELKNEMQDRGYWEQFCNICGSHNEHNAYDLFA